MATSFEEGRFAGTPSGCSLGVSGIIVSGILSLLVTVHSLVLGQTKCLKFGFVLPEKCSRLQVALSGGHAARYRAEFRKSQVVLERFRRLVLQKKC